MPFQGNRPDHPGLSITLCETEPAFGALNMQSLINQPVIKKNSLAARVAELESTCEGLAWALGELMATLTIPRNRELLLDGDVNAAKELFRYVDQKSPHIKDLIARGKGELPIRPAGGAIGPAQDSPPTPD